MPIDVSVPWCKDRAENDKFLCCTGLRDAYRTAFRKLAQLNKANPEPNPVEVFLLHSHPQIKERLALAQHDLY